MSVLQSAIKKRQVELFGKDPETLDELFDMVKVVINDNLKEIGELRVTGLGLRLIENSSVSVWHDAPIGCKTNWGGRDKNAPRYYEGYTGRIWLRVNDKYSAWTNDLFRGSATHTGTGGGGSYDGQWNKINILFFKAPKRLKKKFIDPQITSYDCKVFLQDFPILQEKVEKEKVWDTLKNNKEEKTYFEKWWNDPEQIELDKEFFELVDKTRSRKVLGPGREYK